MTKDIENRESDRQINIHEGQTDLRTNIRTGERHTEGQKDRQKEKVQFVHNGMTGFFSRLGAQLDQTFTRQTTFIISEPLAQSLLNSKYIFQKIYVKFIYSYNIYYLISC